MRSEVPKNPWSIENNRELTHKLKVHVFQYCERRGMPRWTWQHIEDAIQDMFMDPDVQEELNEGTAPLSRLQLIAVHKFIDTLRTWEHIRSKLQQASQHQSERAFENAHHDKYFVDEIVQLDLTREVLEFLAHKRAQGERWANTFWLFWLEGQSYEKIHEQTGLASGTIHGDLKKAIQILRNQFSASD